MPETSAAPKQRSLAQLAATADAVDSAVETRRRHVLAAIRDGHSVVDVSRAARIDAGTVRRIRDSAPR